MKVLLFLAMLSLVGAFIVPTSFRASLTAVISPAVTSLKLSPFGFNDKDEQIISNIMQTKGLDREEAEKDYKSFKANPNGE